MPPAHMKPLAVLYNSLIHPIKRWNSQKKVKEIFKHCKERRRRDEKEKEANVEANDLTEKSISMESSINQSIDDGLKIKERRGV